MPTAAISSSFADMLNFGRFVLRRTGARALLSLTYLMLGSIAEGFSILLLIPLLQLVGPQFQAFKINVNIPFFSKLLNSNIHIGLAPLLAVFVGLMIAQALFMRFKTIYMYELLIRFINELRIELFESIGRARWTRIARMRGSDLNHVLTADVDRINGVTFTYFTLVQGLILLVFYLGIACVVSPAMTAFAGFIGLAVLLVLRPIRKRASAYGAQLTLRRQDEYRIVSEFLTGLKVAKSFNSEPMYFRELGKTIDELAVEQMTWSRVNSISTVVFQIGSALGLAAFVYVAVDRVSLSPSRMLVMIYLFMRIAPRFTALQSQVQDVLVNLPALTHVEAIKAICDEDAEIHDEDPATPFPPLSQQVAFRDVTFSYGGAPVLSNVALVIPARQITALIGPSGGGKSTVADLVMGLLEPTLGVIEIDGVAIDANSRRPWRARVAYVPQDVFLLHDTIAANLRLAAPQATEAMMWDALEKANGRIFVEALPDRLQTVVGDRGARLSGGERQRIALARGLLRQPDLLILDEATSALDGETQASIAEAIEALRGSMTILTIAHRGAMVAIADHVIVIEGGRVVEAGDFDQLSRSASGRLHGLIDAEGSVKTA